MSPNGPSRAASSVPAACVRIGPRTGALARHVLVWPGPAPLAGQGAAPRQAGDGDRRALPRSDVEAVVLPDVAGVRDEDRQLRADAQATPGEVLGQEEVVGRAAQRGHAGRADLGTEHGEGLRAERAALPVAVQDDVGALI